MAYKRQFLVPDFLGVQIVKPIPRKSKVIFSNPNCKIVLLLWVTQGCALISPGHEWQLTFWLHGISLLCSSYDWQS